MAFTSWPFDFEPDGETPQEVTEDAFRHTLAASSQSGVGGEDDLMVSALADSSAVTVSTGYGSVAGYSCYNDGTVQVTAPANTASQPRMYWVVLRLDRASRQIVPAVVEGSASSSPQMPTLARDPDTVFEEPIASFRRAGGGGGITSLVDYRATINPNGSRLVRSTARPPYPTPGERIYEADTGREMYYHSGTWRVAADPAYPGPWQPLTLRSGYTRGNSGRAPGWRWVREGTVELRGTIARTNGSALPQGTYYARLPDEARPSAWVRGVCAAESRNSSGTWGAHARVDVASPGASSFLAGQVVAYHRHDPRWLSLDNFIYDVAES